MTILVSTHFLTLQIHSRAVPSGEPESQITCGFTHLTASEVVPIFDPAFIQLLGGAENAKIDTFPVMRVVIDAFPFPAQDTAWQAVLDFRRRCIEAGTLIRLRRWARSFGQKTRSSPEILDEIEYLLHEYEEFMKLARMKVERGVLETLVVTSAELAQGIVTLKWGDVAKRLFDVSKHDIAIVEAEHRSPGREMAILAHARQPSSGL